MAACRNWTRSQFLRRAVAEAGQGLPAIEPGMPLPAGTGLSRRHFLSRASGLALSVYGASKLGLGAFEEGIAEAASGDGRVLVSVFLDGGFDSMSLLAPVGDPRYATLRPTLAVPQAGTHVFAQDSRLRFHPDASGLATLHAEGKVAALPAVGYTGPNQSHFTSRHFWEVGELDVQERTGWLGRYLDVAGQANNPLQGLTLSHSLAPSLAARTAPVAAVSRIDGYTFDSMGVWNPVADPMRAALGALGAADSPDPTLAAARAATASAARLREQLAGLGAVTSPVAYPTGNSFPTRLQGLAAMIASGLPLRCVALNAAGSYDTHSNQAAAFAPGLKITSDSLLAFQRDLEARGIADRVLTLVWSEFGRRAQENGSGGTDHGAGGCAMVIGAKANGGMVGEFPGLDRLDRDGNLAATTDFRALYSSLLEQWFATDAAGIIPGAANFGRYSLVRS